MTMNLIKIFLLLTICMVNALALPPLQIQDEYQPQQLSIIETNGLADGCVNDRNHQSLSEFIKVCILHPELPTVTRVDQIVSFIAHISIMDSFYSIWTRSTNLVIDVARRDEGDKLINMERIGQLKITKPVALNYLFNWIPSADIYPVRDDGVAEQEYVITISQLSWFGWKSNIIYISDSIYL